jgi:asparagine synthase (glutamine-hydrolysing)
VCGIAGIWDRSHRRAPQEIAASVAAMTEALRYRGPDAGGLWHDPAAGVAIGHRRLSIVDLSQAGAQPMVSSCGRFVLSYNGEIYNAAELRPELEAAGRRFRGRSDTEVIVEGAAQWGVAPTVERLIGMFALALWDRQERILHLVRDRLGIKPLYWGEFDGTLLFGSELKALRADRSWPVALDRDALAAYLRFGYVPAPHAIYQGMRKLPPGTILSLGPDGPPALAAYWSLADVAARGQNARFTGGEAAAADALETLLRDAVRRRMVADVPLGAFLSGGIDSSTVAALMQQESGRPVRTFSIGFAARGYDEAQHAAAVARHLETDHTELYVTPEDALAVVPQLPEMYDEPFADSSQVPTYLVSEMTRRHVTVALSGDGGDELFAGYTRYFRGRTLYRALGAVPPPLRALAATGVRALPPEAWSAFASVLPERRRPAQLGEKLHKIAGVMAAAPGAGGFYRELVSLWGEPAALLSAGSEPAGPLDNPEVPGLVPDVVERMQYLDTLTYLPDDILVKLDRASMAVSLEARVPLLDHRLVAFAWSLPPAMKAGGGVGKRVLRRVLYRHVPRELVDRPKMGFAMPVHSWLRHELRDWAESLLDEARLKRGGVFDPAPIRRRWQEHRDGRRNWQASLWAVLMFEAWRQRWLV